MTVSLLICRDLCEDYKTPTIVLLISSHHCLKIQEIVTVAGLAPTMEGFARIHEGCNLSLKPVKSEVLRSP